MRTVESSVLNPYSMTFWIRIQKNVLLPKNCFQVIKELKQLLEDIPVPYCSKFQWSPFGIKLKCLPVLFFAIRVVEPEQVKKLRLRAGAVWLRGTVVVK